MATQDLTAVSLKDALWRTLNDLRKGEIEPAHADSVAAQAREIIRASRLQVNILNHAKRPMSEELVEFAAPPK